MVVWHTKFENMNIKLMILIGMRIWLSLHADYFAICGYPKSQPFFKNGCFSILLPHNILDMKNYIRLDKDLATFPWKNISFMYRKSKPQEKLKMSLSLKVEIKLFSNYF